MTRYQIRELILDINNKIQKTNKVVKNNKTNSKDTESCVAAIKELEKMRKGLYSLL